MPNPFIWILEKILGPRMTVQERIAHNKRLAGIEESVASSEPAASSDIEEQIDALIAKMESMQAPIMACLPQVGRQSTRADESRLAGWPGWPEGEALPSGPNGRPMLFLCQINFAEMPRFEPFPEVGLMQIFVASDELFGCAFPSKDRQGFTVLYRPDTGGLATADPYPDGHPQDFSVFSGELQRTGRPLAFERQEMVAPASHYEIEAGLQAIWKQYMDADFGRFDDYCFTLEGPEMYLGGHPRFVQYDIRSPDHLADYDQVIMQFGAPKDMMWGDVGEACFLMRRKDLQNRAFEKAIYNWDCS